MATQPTGPPGTVNTEITLKGDNWQMNARVTVPTGPTRLDDMLPLAWALSDSVVNETSRAVEQSGQHVSCKKGCGACCRNLVAISEAEARRLRSLVDAMPEPRRSEVRARFADARQRLESAGLLERLRKSDQWTDAEYGSLAVSYFKQQVACPFLEEESCSIHPERPITCREYLVMSPAENCSKPYTEPVTRVRLPLLVFNAVARWQSPPGKHLEERCVPLVLALEWAEAHPEEPPPQPGLDLLRELLDHLTNKEVKGRTSEPGKKPDTPKG